MEIKTNVMELAVDEIAEQIKELRYKFEALDKQRVVFMELAEELDKELQSDMPVTTKKLAETGKLLSSSLRAHIEATKLWEKYLKLLIKLPPEKQLEIMASFKN